MYIVTGGGRGLGRALAHALSGRGEQVLIVGRHEETLRETAAFSPTIAYLQMDVSSASDRERLYAYLAPVSTIKGLIHNAGVIDPLEALETISLSSWRTTMMTNVEGPLFLSQGLLKKLDGGRVLHIGSGAAYFPVAGWAAYCTSKAALSMLTKSWQLETTSPAFASVMPGIVDTAMVASIRHAQNIPAEKRDYFNWLKQEERLLTPETVACFLCWLLLDINQETYVSKEWDIYDKSHHQHWLVEPHVVPDIE